MPRAIIRGLGGYQDYPFDAIDPASLRHLANAANDKQNNGILTYLECYLEVTGKSITGSFLATPHFSTLALEFLGALNSNRFIECSLMRRYTLSRRWIRALEELAAHFPNIELPPVKIRTVGPDPLVRIWAQTFEAQQLFDEKIWLWKGWASISRSGVCIRMPLYPIYRRLGRTFTEKLFAELNSWFRGRNTDRVPCLRSLASFIGQYPKDLTAGDFQNRDFVSEFWTEFCTFFVRSAFQEGKGSRLSSITMEWQAQFLPLLRKTLIRSGLFAEPWGALPMLWVKKTHGSKYKLKRTPQGHEVKTKTLTHIPVHVSDEEAYHLLFKKIREELDTVKRVANQLCEDIWRRHQYRIAAADTGTPRFVRAIGTNAGDNKWLTNRKNPEHLTNACATFAEHGYLPRTDASIVSLYPLPLSVTAAELALPIAEALFPHCILLVIEHPKITAAFLEGVELYDKNEKLCGFVEGDTGYRLVGHKRRRGPRLAQQVVHLSEKAATLVKQIIAITDSVRTYLRARRDDNWRFLLLSCGKGFGYPMRWRKLSAGKCIPFRREKLVTALGVSSNLTLPEREDLVARLTLSSVRASAGVLVYLETKSVEKMAEALGHVEYHADLLAHYLPKTISDFFQERWIRIFQTGIIVEALKQSPALMDAADFSNLEELHQFLAHHSLKVPPDSSSYSPDDFQSGQKCYLDNRVIFGVSVSILVALLSLEMSVQVHRDVANAKALYWAGVANALVSHIEGNKRDRPDIAAQLQVAKSQAKPYSESFTRGS